MSDTMNKNDTIIITLKTQEGSDVLKKREFFKNYDCREEFEQSGLEWNELVRIYKDYSRKQDDLEKIKDELIEYLKEGAKLKNYHFHSISGRVKDKNHVIEKIIRKCGKERLTKYLKINSTNYRDVIRDLIGVRILSLSKENWESVFDLINDRFAEFESVGPEDERPHLAEPPIAYTRYGDRDIYHYLIHQEHTNKGYRSQHYIVKFKGVYCEIQARTLAEEVYGEFDHKVKYPYKESNTFLKRYTSIISQNLDAVDEMISTCLGMDEGLIDKCDRTFEHDTYINWESISRPIRVGRNHNDEAHISSEEVEEDGNIVLEKYISRKLLRKGSKENGE